MKSNKTILVLAPVLFLIMIYCGGGQPQKEKQETGESIGGVLRTILLAESIENIKQKEELLQQVYGDLSKTETEMAKQKKKGIGASQDLDTLLALFYYVKGDYKMAQLYVDKYKGLSNVKSLGVIVESRLLLKKNGTAQTKIVINNLNNVVSKRGNKSLAYLVLGDAYYSQLNIGSAKESYKKVLHLGGVLQVLAADRLETINKIEQTKLDPQKFQSLIFAKTLRRGEIADLLFRVYGINKKFRSRSKETVAFTDIDNTEYAASIKALKQGGFFSYIKGTNFEPLKSITRRELALIIEDYIVLIKGNTTYRKMFTGDKNSPIENLPVSDEAYNAVRLAVQNNIMDLSLSGSINLNEAINGLEGLIAINRMLKK